MPRYPQYLCIYVWRVKLNGHIPVANKNTHKHTSLLPSPLEHCGATFSIPGIAKRRRGWSVDTVALPGEEVSGEACCFADRRPWWIRGGEEEKDDDEEDDEDDDGDRNNEEVEEDDTLTDANPPNGSALSIAYGVGKFFLRLLSCCTKRVNSLLARGFSG